jgi:hypothetical protein
MSRGALKVFAGRAAPSLITAPPDRAATDIGAFPRPPMVPKCSDP